MHAIQLSCVIFEFSHGLQPKFVMSLMSFYIPALEYEREEEAHARNAKLASKGRLPGHCLWEPRDLPDNPMLWTKWWD